jgi:hypothetical protein
MAFTFDKWVYAGKYNMYDNLSLNYSYTATINHNNGNIIIADQDDLREYTVSITKLSSSYTISLTLVKTKLSVTGHWIQNMYMSEDGSKLYTYSVLDKVFRQHNMSTAYDITTLSQYWYDDVNYVDTYDQIRGIYAIGDNVLYINMWDDVVRYTMTGGNLSTMSYHSRKDGPRYRSGLWKVGANELITAGGNIVTNFDLVTGIDNLSTATMSSDITIPSGAKCANHIGMTDEYFVLGSSADDELYFFVPKPEPPMLGLYPTDKTKFIPNSINI